MSNRIAGGRVSRATSGATIAKRILKKEISTGPSSAPDLEGEIVIWKRGKRKLAIGDTVVVTWVDGDRTTCAFTVAGDGAWEIQAPPIADAPANDQLPPAQECQAAAIFVETVESTASFAAGPISLAIGYTPPWICASDATSSSDLPRVMHEAAWLTLRWLIGGGANAARAFLEAKTGDVIR